MESFNSVKITDWRPELLELVPLWWRGLRRQDHRHQGTAQHVMDPAAFLKRTPVKKGIPLCIKNGVMHIIIQLSLLICDLFLRSGYGIEWKKFLNLFQ